MFLNDYRNRLQNTAIPVLFLDAPPPPPPRAPRPPNQLKIVGTHLMLVRSPKLFIDKPLTCVHIFRKTVSNHPHSSE